MEDRLHLLSDLSVVVAEDIWGPEAVPTTGNASHFQIDSHKLAEFLGEFLPVGRPDYDRLRPAHVLRSYDVHPILFIFGEGGDAELGTAERERGV